MGRFPLAACVLVLLGRTDPGTPRLQPEALERLPRCLPLEPRAPGLPAELLPVLEELLRLFGGPAEPIEQVRILPIQLIPEMFERHIDRLARVLEIGVITPRLGGLREAVRRRGGTGATAGRGVAVAAGRGAFRYPIARLAAVARLFQRRSRRRVGVAGPLLGRCPLGRSARLPPHLSRAPFARPAFGSACGPVALGLISRARARRALARLVRRGAAALGVGLRAGPSGALLIGALAAPFVARAAAVAFTLAAGPVRLLRAGRRRLGRVLLTPGLLTPVARLLGALLSALLRRRRALTVRLCPAARPG